MSINLLENWNMIEIEKYNCNDLMKLINENDIGLKN